MQKITLQATYLKFQIRISYFAAGSHSNGKFIYNKSVHSSEKSLFLGRFSTISFQIEYITQHF